MRTQFATREAEIREFEDSASKFSNLQILEAAVIQLLIHINDMKYKVIERDSPQQRVNPVHPVSCSRRFVIGAYALNAPITNRRERVQTDEKPTTGKAPPFYMKQNRNCPRKNTECHCESAENHLAGKSENFLKKRTELLPTKSRQSRGRTINFN
ncbi:MAG: hypothetical protein LBE91_21000 [Tannerella sp.]|jgi:hypothetical protein|nr:hypothetical protein [Tannerella sp.]